MGMGMGMGFGMAMDMAIAEVDAQLWFSSVSQRSALVLAASSPARCTKFAFCVEADKLDDVPPALSRSRSLSSHLSVWGQQKSLYDRDDIYDTLCGYLCGAYARPLPPLGWYIEHTLNLCQLGYTERKEEGPTLLKLLLLQHDRLVNVKGDLIVSLSLFLSLTLSGSRSAQFQDSLALRIFLAWAINILICWAAVFNWSTRSGLTPFDSGSARLCSARLMGHQNRRTDESASRSADQPITRSPDQHCRLNSN